MMFDRNQQNRWQKTPGQMPGVGNAFMPSVAKQSLNQTFGQAVGRRNQGSMLDYLRDFSMADSGNQLADQTARSQSTLGMGNYLLGRQREALQQRGQGMSMLMAMMGQHL